MVPMPNNGTYRLPMRPVGLHEPGAELDTPHDPVTSYTVTSTTETPAVATASVSNPVGVDPVDASPTPSNAIGVDPPKSKPTGEPEPGDNEGGSSSKVHEFWDWVTDKWHKVWDKISGSKGSDPEKTESSA